MISSKLHPLITKWDLYNFIGNSNFLLYKSTNRVDSCCRKTSDILRIHFTGKT